jgi:hypothetical protein
MDLRRKVDRLVCLTSRLHRHASFRYLRSVLLISIRFRKLIGPIAETGELLASTYFEFIALMLKFVEPILYQIVDLCCTFLGLIVQSS